MTQINPPFDGSLPCPACQDDLRNIAALLHNTFTRWPSGKAFVRLHDLCRTPIPEVLTVPHPASQEMLDVARALVAACDGMTEDGLTVRWTPEVTERVAAIANRAKAALDGWEQLSRVHFHDKRHASGCENILHERKGSRWAGFVAPDYKAAEYDYTIERVEDGADLVHTVCGTGLKLHGYFLAELRRDPSFFAKVWCPKCHNNTPLTQWLISGARG